MTLQTRTAGKASVGATIYSNLTKDVTGNEVKAALLNLLDSAIIQEDWQDVASASPNIGASPSSFVRLTGSTPVTAFDNVAAGIWRYIRFGGAIALTHNATSLILNAGGADITTAIGDFGIAKSEGSGNWRLWVLRSSGKAVTPSAFSDITGKPTTISGYGIADGVVGPASAVDNHITRFDLTTGKVIQSSNGVIDDSGNLSGIGGVSISGIFDIVGDTYLRRRAAANWNLGTVDVASPVAQSLSVQSVVAGTSNTAGPDVTWNASQGTGTGAGGSHVFRTAPAGSTGSTQNALAAALTIGPALITAALGVRTLAGSVSAPGLQVGDADTGFYQTSAQLHIALDGVEIWRAISTGIAFGAGFDPTEALHVRRTGGTAARILVDSEGVASILARRYSADATSPSMIMGKARGTIASPAVISSSDNIFVFNGQAHNGTSFNTPFSILATVIAGTPSSSDMEARCTISLAPSASAASSEILRLDHASGLSLYGANPVIDANRLFRLRSYTVSTLPAAGNIGRRAMVSDATAPTYGGALTGSGAVKIPVFDNGAAWVSL